MTPQPPEQQPRTMGELRDFPEYGHWLWWYSEYAVSKVLDGLADGDAMYRLSCDSFVAGAQWQRQHPEARP